MMWVFPSQGHVERQPKQEMYKEKHCVSMLRALMIPNEVQTNEKHFVFFSGFGSFWRDSSPASMKAYVTRRNMGSDKLVKLPLDVIELEADAWVIPI